MNAKMKTTIVRDVERAPSQSSSDQKAPPCSLDCYSHYDLEWIEFLIESRKRKDGMHGAKVAPEFLPNVWNIPEN